MVNGAPFLCVYSNIKLLPQASCLYSEPVPAQVAETPLLTALSYVAGFGWDACEKGNWYETLNSQIPELQVRFCNLFCRGAAVLASTLNGTRNQY